MAVFTNTELNATIDERWDMEVEDAFYAGSVLVNRVSNKSKVAAGHGDIVNLTDKSKYTVGAVTAATGAFTPQTITPTSTAVTLDQWRQCAIEVVDRSRWQSFWDPESDFPGDAGKALGEDVDTQLRDLHTSLTSNDVGQAESPITFDDIAMLESMLKLANRDIPKDELSYVLPPEGIYKGILTKPEFRDADKTGLPKSALTTGFVVPLLGVPVYQSTLMASAGTGNISKVGLLLHKTALAVAFQKNNDIRRADGVAAGKLVMIVAVNSLYGVKAWITTRASRIFIRAS